jgi:hypothetical protein
MEFSEEICQLADVYDAGDDGLTEYEWRNGKPTKKKGLDYQVELRVADELRSRCRIYFPLRETVQTSKGGIGVSDPKVPSGSSPAKLMR